MARLRKDYVATKVHGSVRRRSSNDRRNALMCPYCAKPWPDRTYTSKLDGQPVEVRAFICRERTGGCGNTWHEMRAISGQMAEVLIRIRKGMM